jgi:hypothetical protein
VPTFVRRLFGASMLCVLALGGCAPRVDACAASGYDPAVCADEQSRRAAAIAILGAMRSSQPPAYQLPMPQTYTPQLYVPHQAQCTSVPNGAGGFYTTCQ